LGWASKNVADAAGLSGANVGLLMARPKVQAVTARRIAAVYDELCMRVPVGRSKGERIAITRTRNMAAAKGWVPPLGWDDIDDPGENPGERKKA